MKAAELRGPLPDHTEGDIRQRRLNREATRAELERDVKEEEEEQFMAGIKEAMQKHLRLEDVPGVRSPALLVDAQLDDTAGYLR